jgi:enamine deaminase RidA (YjgF/YER057c/UK114 family)
VITEGGKAVWLGGQIAVVDDAGRSLAGDFEGQVRQIFKLLNATLEKAGGKLSDMVQMTVFITDVRNGDRLTNNSLTPTRLERSGSARCRSFARCQSRAGGSLVPGVFSTGSAL